MAMRRRVAPPDLGTPTTTDEVSVWVVVLPDGPLTYLQQHCTTSRMKTARETGTVCFSVKGQVVIPRWLRKEFEIDAGTRAQVYAEGDHIILRPLTARRYDKLQGCLKGAGVLEALTQDRKREREL